MERESTASLRVTKSGGAEERPAAQDPQVAILDQDPHDHELVGFELLVGHTYDPRYSQAVKNRLRTSFEKQHGRIETNSWSKAISGAVALTNRPGLYRCYPVVDLPIYEAADRQIEKCMRLAARAELFVGESDRRIFIGDLYEVCSTAFDVLAHAQAAKLGEDAPLGDEVVLSVFARLEDTFKEIAANFAAAAQREAQFVYFLGMLGGLGLVLLAVLGWSIFGPGIGMGPGAVAGVFLAGAGGAAVSVLTRMTSGKLRLAYESGKRMLLLLGAFRAFVGAGFAGALFALIGSGLVPVTVPTDETTRSYFFAAIGFLAGFFERWAQDMLSFGIKTISVVRKDSPAAETPA